MGSLRYIGSKARLADEVLRIAGPPEGRFLDFFSGTGVVSSKAADFGWSIFANDHLWCAAVLTEAQLISYHEATFKRLGGYTEAINRLRHTSKLSGFIAQNYSPESLELSGIERRYFTASNAQFIDSVRDQIEAWYQQGIITRPERVLLIADLLEAANAVANIAGTYGCFMKKWTSTGLKSISLEPRKLRTTPVDYQIASEDVFNLRSGSDDTVYLDPPYTKRQYASYYHILETIAAGDCPQIEGTCGLRPWHHLASPFCYKRRAHTALKDLITNIEAKRVLLSYSSEGHVDVHSLAEDLKGNRDVDVIDAMEFGRYRPNVAASQKNSTVREYIVDIKQPKNTSKSLKSQQNSLGEVS